MASRVHQVESTRPDLAAALNMSEGVRDIKVGKQALKKLIKQTEALLEAGERVEFASYYYLRGLTMVTYYLIVVTDVRVMRINRTTWKRKPYIQKRDTVTEVQVSTTGDFPRVTLRRGEASVTPFPLARADAERLAEQLSRTA